MTSLIGRVRAELGRVVSHPHAIEVAAIGGHVTLIGPILSHEVRPLLRAVRRVPGVRAVSDQLTVYSEPGNVSSLQGGEPRTGKRFELLQENWSPAARMIAGGAGAALMLAATQSRGGMRALLGVSGGALLARAADQPRPAQPARLRRARHHGAEDHPCRRAGRARVRLLDRLPELPALHAQRARGAAGGREPLALGGRRAGRRAGAVDRRGHARGARRAHRVALGAATPTCGTRAA